MGINQEFVERLTPATIADAIAANFRVGEQTTITETGMSYVCNATAGDITLTNGLFLKATDKALRGKSDYPEYVGGKAYALGVKVYNKSEGVYYRNIKAASSSDPFTSEFWQEFTLESGFALMDAATATNSIT